MNIIEETQKEISKLEKLLKGIDMFLSGSPEGCLKWQNKSGKIYYYQQYMQDMQMIGQNQKLLLQICCIKIRIIFYINTKDH